MRSRGRKLVALTILVLAGTCDGQAASRARRNTETRLRNSISAGVTGDHTCQVMGDGTARCWGLNDHGQLGDDTTTNRLTPVTVSGLSGVEAIAAGSKHTCALVSTNPNPATVRCWGDNNFGQLGDRTSTTRPTPVAATGLTNVTTIPAAFGP